MTTTTTASAPVDEPVVSPNRRRDVALGASGIGFFVLLLAVIAVPHSSLDYPVKKPPASSVITEFFSNHYGLEQYQALMHSLAALMFMVFGVALAAQVRRHELVGRVASRLVTAGAAATATVMLVTMLLVAGTITMTGGIDGRTQGWLYELAWNEHFKLLYPAALVLAPACLVLGRTRALPRTLTWLGLLVSLLCLIAMVGVLTSGTEFLQFPVFFLLMLWVLATGIVALVRGVGVRER
jgi:hypothetical protein